MSYQCFYMQKNKKPRVEEINQIITAGALSNDKVVFRTHTTQVSDTKGFLYALVGEPEVHARVFIYTVEFLKGSKPRTYAIEVYSPEQFNIKDWLECPRSLFIEAERLELGGYIEFGSKRLQEVLMANPEYCSLPHSKEDFVPESLDIPERGDPLLIKEAINRALKRPSPCTFNVITPQGVDAKLVKEPLPGATRPSFMLYYLDNDKSYYITKDRLKNYFIKNSDDIFLYVPLTPYLNSHISYYTVKNT